MNFAEFIHDQQRNLFSKRYVNMLWSKIRECIPLPSVTLADEEQYRNHIPVDFHKFLKKCVTKLRELKIDPDEIQWNGIDEKYLSTLIYFALEQENVTVENGLYASNLFILINTLHPSRRFFYKTTYVKVLEVLKEFNQSQDMTSNIIMFLMDDLKGFYRKISLPEDVINATASVLYGYTNCCNDAFEDISPDVSFENLGYMAFVNLKVLVEHLSKQKHNDRRLFPILLALTSSLRSASTNNLSRTVKEAHQKNVRLFITQNFKLFQSRTVCLVTNMLKVVCLCPEFDEYDAIAQIIQQLPCETNQNFITYIENAMVCNREDFRKNLLNHVLPILRHPAEYETNSKRMIRAEIFLYNVTLLLVEKSEEIRSDALRILAEASEDSLGRRVLRKLMSPENFDDINKDTIQDTIFGITDKTWSKKGVNISYIQLMCNFLVIRKDLITLQALNRVRNLCRAATPNDLKPCITHFKRLMEHHSSEINVVMYTLSIIIKQMFHPMATSTVFAKELHDFIFSNITPNEEDNFIWNIVNVLISYNFDAFAIFERFNSLQFLGNNSVRILMEYKIHERCSRTPALKLLCLMLNYVQYNQSHCLDEKLEGSIVGNDSAIPPTDFCLIIYALTKILEKKRPGDCSGDEISNYKQMQFLVCQAFFDQMFPVACVKYIIALLDAYAHLIQEDVYWDTAGCAHFEEDLTEKLRRVCQGTLQNEVYICRDIIYISELVMLQKTTLTQTNFNQLKEIVNVANHTKALSNYLDDHSKIWALCISLYVKVCFVNSELVQECIENLEKILQRNIINNQLELQIIYMLYDMCSLHLQYYDPLVPHLFEALYSADAYMRFIASKLVMRLISEDHLRLSDGRYFLFMGLLADDKTMIAKNVEMFIKETYVTKYPQNIARYLVPSIIHFNYCYDHPSISLTEGDQELLRRKTYTRSDRCDIYYSLHQFLPETVKFSILNQIRIEVLDKMTHTDLLPTTEGLRVLEDSLTVILFTFPKDKLNFIEVEACEKYFHSELIFIETDLLKPNFNKNGQQTFPAGQVKVIKKLLLSLFELLYSGLSDRTGKIYQNIVFTITVLTRIYYSPIKHHIHQESSGLKNMYFRLRSFVYSKDMHFESYHLSVDPRNIPLSSEREDTEFYLQEVNDFTMVAPHLVAGIITR